MRTLIYKRTHNGDPDDAGCFGCRDCMGSVRGWQFDAVIGVGGIGDEARSAGITERLNWVGIGPRKTFAGGLRGPLVTFDRFLMLGSAGPLLGELAPALAARMYGHNVRLLIDGLTERERAEAEGILALAADAPPSRGVERLQGSDTKQPRCAARPRRSC